MSDRSYWRISEGSPTMAVIVEALKQQRLFESEIQSLKKEFDATDALIWKGWHGTTFSGLTFKGSAPEGWRKSKSCYKPDKRRKIGRELAARFDALPRGIEPPTFSDMLRKSLGLEFTLWAEGRVAWTIYEKFGDTYILSTPAGLKLKRIPGCEELKMSEYWQLRESSELKPPSPTTTTEISQALAGRNAGEGEGDKEP